MASGGKKGEDESYWLLAFSPLTELKFVTWPATPCATLFVALLGESVCSTRSY
ncbi:hypothetical protein IAD21_01805 [Abditibacteriota bacterium]|nr:hypothetical protein IAD21_01805 [Abditibacteriota bacterium]